jgi:hypothetical protein
MDSDVMRATEHAERAEGKGGDKRKISRRWLTARRLKKLKGEQV